MIDRTPLARAATERLASAEPKIAAPGPAARDAAVAAIAQAIVASARARRRRRVAWAAVAVAAGVAAIGSARVLSRGARSTEVVAQGGDGVTLSHGGAVGPLAGGIALAGGDRVHVPPFATASLSLSTGTRVDVEGGSDLVLVAKDGDQIFALDAGATRFSVAKVEPGRRFVVRTADVEIEVRGTAFRVATGQPTCDGTTTRVWVSEGTVVVRRAGQEWALAAGGGWPAGCSEPAATTTVPAIASTNLPASIASSAAPATPHKATEVKVIHEPKPASDLAAQNDLFAEATAKKRAGDRAGAAAAYERLLAKWPSGPLAETAAIERMRLLQGTARRDAAKSYLARWPNGSARREAEAFAAGH